MISTFLPSPKEQGLRKWLGQHAQKAVIAFVPKEDSQVDHITQALFQRAARLKTPFRIADVLCISCMPKSNTFKVKRHELAAHYKKRDAAERQRSEATEDERIQTLKSFFQAVLPDKKSVITADIAFAELGIDSLLAVQLCEKINSEWHTQLKPTAFWFCRNIRELDVYLKMKEKKRTTSITKHSTSPIAIIAVSADFPGEATDFETFWKHLVAGKDAIIEVPKSRWDIADYYDPYLLAPGKTNSRYGGFIHLPDRFPNEEFGIKPSVSKVMGPQQKILLVQAKKLLTSHPVKNTIEKWHVSKTAVFIGGHASDFIIQSVKQIPLTQVTAFSGIGMGTFSMASRLSYHFKLQGPAMTIDTACSSSLVAVHQAIRALQMNDCDYAIAGGINVILTPDLSVCLTKGGFLSPDGRCKTFDATANGYVRSEACGLVLLKRYSDAVQDGDPILGVILGAAINQDGDSNGITAPNGAAQMACYQEALKRAKLSANAVNFVEAHGTGTKLGDAIEMQSIQSVYDQGRSTDNPLYVGAIKSAVGHCESASGIAGLLKTIGVLQHQIIPPNLHYHQPNPNINFTDSAVILPNKAITLPNQNCQYAAVSSFGIAGTNVHMILK